MPEHTVRPLTTTAAALVFMSALASCGAGPSQTTAPAAITQAAATPSPSPTVPPIDVADAFASKARGSLTLSTELSGSLRIGDDLEGEVSGELQVIGADVRNLMVITFPGLPPQETETISVDGKRYERSAQGYWLLAEPTRGDSNGSPVSAALARTDDLEVVGTEEHGGETLHRLESTDPPEITADVFGITDPTVADFAAEVAFLADDDGTMAGIILTASWSQGPAASAMPAELELWYMAVDTIAEVLAPDDPWSVYRSAELGYQMAHPADWDVAFEPAAAEFPDGDLYIAPVDGQVEVYRFTDLGGALANEWFRGSVDLLAESYGTAPEVLSTLQLANGLEAQILALHYTDEAQGTFYHQQGVVYGGDVAWDVDWFSLAGNEREDQARFLQFVTSFERVTQ